MPGIGAAIGNLVRSGVGKELVAQAESAAVQQAGAQVGAAVLNSPHALRQKIGAVEQYGMSPASMGGTFLDGWFPEFKHTIFVAASGGPDASIKDVWKLVVATVFGRFRQRIATFAGCGVECIWDISDKTVAMRLTYSSNGLIPAVVAGLGLQGGLSAAEVIQSGPSAETVGAGWGGFLQTIGQLFNKGTNNARAIGGRITPTQTTPNPDPTTEGLLTRSGRLEREDGFEPPLLLDDGRLITTEDYTDPNVQPPRPANYQDFVGIVSNALTNPCVLPCKPPVGEQVNTRLSFRYYQPGFPPKDKDTFIAQAEQRARNRIAAGDQEGELDGYEKPTAAQVPQVPNECEVRIAELRADPNQAEPE